MKKFLLFVGDAYYPEGGWNDFVDSFDSVEEAKEKIPEDCDWWHVINSEGKKVEEGQTDTYKKYTYQRTK